MHGINPRCFDRERSDRSGPQPSPMPVSAMHSYRSIAMAVRFRIDLASPLHGHFVEVHDSGPIAALRAAFDRARQRRLLAELDEWLLRDVGITRSQALGEAGKPFWRR